MKIYMYPISNPNKSSTRNPYIDNLINSIEENNCTVINKTKINKFGVADLLLYIPKVDVYYLNWIENLPDKRFGWVQSILFIIIFFVLKLLRKKIVWMMHNKLSHSKKGLLIKIMTNYILLNYSDFIFTHSKEGVRFGNTLLHKDKNINFRHHPFDNFIQANNIEKKSIDILIWGSISPYKGIDIFLEYLYEHGLEKKYSIYITGRITDSDLSDKLKSYRSENIVIEDTFVSLEKLEELFLNSKVVLFTYAGYSTLASGALMDTLKYGNSVLGPDVGAFRDLKEEGIIETFIRINDIQKQLDKILLKDKINKKQLVNFIEKNTWSKFGNWLCLIVNREE